MALIEIDGLPINSMGMFHGYVSHNQMVNFVVLEPSWLGMALFMAQRVSHINHYRFKNLFRSY